MEYLVVVEKGETSYGAFVPDLPGCAAVAETRREVLKLIREGIALHIEALRELASRYRRRFQKAKLSRSARHNNAMHAEAPCPSRPLHLWQRARRPAARR
jgi:predicted RNase H-like HicB family nuclease